MWIAISVFGAIIVLGLLLIVVSDRWGASKVEKRQADKTVSERARDANIDGQPFIDDPLDRMRE